MQKSNSFSIYSALLTYFQKNYSTIELVASESRLLLIPELAGGVFAVSSVGKEGNALFPGKLGSSDLLKEEGCSLYWANQCENNVKNTELNHLLSTPWDVVEVSPETSTFQLKGSIANSSDPKTELALLRRISILDPLEIKEMFSFKIPENVTVAAYESLNQLQNTGEKGWVYPDLPVMGVDTCFPISDSALMIFDFSEQLVTEFTKAGFEIDKRFENKLAVNLTSLTGKRLELFASKAPGRVIFYDLEQKRLSLLFYSLDHRMDASAMAVVKHIDYSALNLSRDFDKPIIRLQTFAPPVELDAGEIRFHSQRIFHFEGDKSDLEYLISSL